MSLLEVITKASVNPENVASRSEYPLVLNPEESFLNLKPKLENPETTSLVSPVTGWKLAQTDSRLTIANNKVYAKLKRKLKDTNNFNEAEFNKILHPFLKKLAEKVGIYVGVHAADRGYTQALVEKVGFLMGQDVVGLVLEAFVNFDKWELVKVMIVNGMVCHSCYADLVLSLAAKKRSDLLCLCIKHAPDLGLPELVCILKYFLCPSEDAYDSMKDVREEWERQALLAIQRVADSFLADKRSSVAKDASILLMIAHDGFSTSELCLHYLLASSNVDEVILSSATGKLNGKEMLCLIRYLGKWLKKYEMFPQAVPCPDGSSVLGLEACKWVPKLEDIARCLGLVLDENFSSLVWHTELQEELKSIEGLVTSMASEAKFCCSVASVIENLKIEDKGQENLDLSFMLP